MHGLIFAGLRDYSIVRLGERKATELWQGRQFELDEAYDDTSFAAQVDRLAAATGEQVADVERGFGSFVAQQTFTELFPAYYEESADCFAFLLGIEEKIHEVVRATIPGASPPKLHVHAFGDLGVLVSYTSERGLCTLLEGLVLGTATYYGDEIAIEELQCMRRGDPGCVFSVQRAESDAPHVPGALLAVRSPVEQYGGTGRRAERRERREVVEAGIT